MKMKKGIAVALTAAILTSGGGLTTALATATPAEAASSQNEISSAIAQILAETNAERAKEGLAPLKIADSMNQVSQAWTEQMAAQKAMYHNPDYQFTLPENWMRVGENVGQGYTTSTIVAAWMASPGHRQNIMGDFTHIGLGYWVDDTGRGWFTQNFGKYAPVENPSIIDTPTTTVNPFNFTSTWTAKPNETVDLYRVELYDSTGYLVTTRTIDRPTFTIDELEEMTEYTVKVTAHATDATGLTYQSPTKTYKVTTPEDLPTVTAPKNLSLTATEKTVKATWEIPSSHNGNLHPYTLELRKGTQLVETVEVDDTEHTFSQLQTNTNYTVTVIATTQIRLKTATAQASESAQTLLSSSAMVSEPENLTITPSSHSQIDLTWETPVQVEGVGLKYYVELTGGGQTHSKVTTDTKISFIGLSANTYYTGKVQAFVASEDGANEVLSDGASQSITTPENVDVVSSNAPTYASVHVEPNQATLYWNEPTDVTGKVVEYEVILKEENETARVFKTTDTSYELYGLKENVNYEFGVRAYVSSLSGKNFGYSPTVTSAHKTPYAQDTAIVSEPRDIAIQAPAYNQITSTWNAPSVIVGNFAGYDVTLIDENGTVVATKRVTTPNVTFNGLQDSTVYFVNVAAVVTSADNSKTVTSLTVFAQKDTPAHVSAPNAPTGLKTTTLTHSATNLTWNEPIGIYGNVKNYTVTLKEAGKADQVFTTRFNYHAISGLAENNKYTVTVVANVTSRDGSKVATTPAATLGITTPYSPSAVIVSAPTGLKVAGVTYNSATASWTAPTGTVGTLNNYTVIVKEGTTVKGTYTTAGTSYDLTGLKSNTAYTVLVRANAKSANNVNSATSADATVITTTGKSPVVNVAAPVTSLTSVQHDRVTTSWTKPSVTGTITGYKVIVKSGSTVVKTVNANAATLSTVITGLEEVTDYTVTVEANAVAENGVNTAASSSTPKSFTTTIDADSIVTVAAPTSLVLNATENTASASWNPPAVTGKIVGYIVVLKQGSTVKGTYATTATSQSFTGLSNDTAYTVEVKANAASTNNKNTATSNVTTGTISTEKSSVVNVAAPVANASNIQHDRATVSWSKPAVTGTITGYKMVVKSGATVVKTINVSASTLSSDVTGLIDNTDYTVTVEVNAVAANGVSTDSATSTAKSFKTPVDVDAIVQVSAPTSLNLNANENSATATWNAPAVTGKIANYSIVLKQGTTVKGTFVSTGTSYNFTGLNSDTAYTVEVKANAVSTNGKNSASSSALVGNFSTNKSSIVNVVAPVANASGIQHDRATVSWNKPAVTGTITGYKVTVKSGSTVVKTVNATPSTLSTVITGLNENTDYTATVEVTAVAENGVGTAKAVSTAKLFKTTIDANSIVMVSAPTSLATSATTNSVTASWKAPTVTGKVTDYTVSLLQGTSVVKTFTTTNLNTTFTGLAEKTSYTVQVRANAVSTNGKNQASSAYVSKSLTTATTSASMVSANTPVISRTSATDSTVSAWWKTPAVTGKISSYTVIVKQGTKTVKTHTTTGTSLRITGLAEKTGYTVQVRANAVSSNGKYKASSAYSAGKAATTTTSVASTVKANTPVISKTSATYNSVSAWWKTPAVTGKLVNYTVVLKQGTKTVKTATTTNASYKFTGLAEKTGYTVQVRANAVSANGKYKASSSYASKNVTTSTSPASTVKVSTPAITKTSATYNSVSAWWKAPAVTGKISNYTVIVKLGTKTVKTVNASGTSLRITGLAEKTGYTVQVRANAVSSNGKYKASSAYTAAKKVSTATSPASTVKASIPAMSKTSATYNSVSAWWKKPAVTGKLVNYTAVLKLGSKYIKTVNTTNTSYKFTGLAEKTGYTVYVRANAVSTNGKYKASSGYLVKKVNTGTSPASTVKVNKPSISKTSVTSTSVSAWWKKPSVTGKLVNYTIVLKQGSKYIKTVNTTSLSYKFTGLKKNNSYTVYVKANAKSSNGKYKASSAYYAKNVKTNR